MINHPKPKFRISLMLATDDDDTVNLYNRIDKSFNFFDISDDYLSELNEIIRVQGRDFKFTQGDYFCKFLLAPICSELDKLDEKKLDINKITKYFTETYDKVGLDEIDRMYLDDKHNKNSLNKCYIL